MPVDPGKIRFRRLWPDRLRLGARRARPQLRWLGPRRAALRARALRGPPRPELHRRGRQDHPPRERAWRGSHGARGALRGRVRRRHGRARQPAPPTLAPEVSGARAADRRDDRDARREGLRVPGGERRRLLLGPRVPRLRRLAKRNLDDLLAGARVETGEAKRDPLDFALWKAAKPGEPAWDSPWRAAAAPAGTSSARR